MAHSQPSSVFTGSGYRLTGPRQAVVEALSSWDGPFTVEDLAAELQEVGRATVFRTVKLLLEQGVVCRLPLEDGTVRYLVSQGEHHHHLTCRDCGLVVDFSDRDLDERIQASASRAGFSLESHSVELYGRCSDCRPAAGDE